MDYFNAPNGFRQRRTIKCTTPPHSGDNPPENTVYEWYAIDDDKTNVYLIYRFPDGTEKVISAQGPPGATGPGGSSGATGPTGATGPVGLRGIDGLIGSFGPDGATGIDGIAGKPGYTGGSGATGYDGATGASGPRSINSDTAFIICYNSLSESIPPYAVIQCNDNENRPKGATGPTYRMRASKVNGSWPPNIYINGSSEAAPLTEFEAYDDSNGPIQVLICDEGLNGQDLMELEPGLEVGPIVNSWYTKIGYPSIGTLLRVVEGATGATGALAWIRYHPTWIGPNCLAKTSDTVFKSTSQFTVEDVVSFDRSMSPAYLDSNGWVQVKNPHYQDDKGMAIDAGDEINIELYYGAGATGSTGLAVNYRVYDAPCGTIAGAS